MRISHRFTLPSILVCCLATPSFAAVDFVLFEVDNRPADQGFMVRFVHAVSGFPALKIELGDGTVFESVPARGVTAFHAATVEFGQVGLRVFGLGSGPETLLYESSLPLHPIYRNTVAITGDAIEALPYTFSAAPPGEPTGTSGFAVVNSVRGQDFQISGVTEFPLPAPAGGGGSGEFAAGMRQLEVLSGGNTILTIRDLILAPDRSFALFLVAELEDESSPAQIRLQDARFRVEADWRAFDGSLGIGNDYSANSQTGEFWFFQESVLELAIKILDGRPLNSHWWVYLASLSNVEFAVTVFDLGSRTARIYNNSPGNFSSFGDIEAFPAD
jgi:hypothetical protein